MKKILLIGDSMLVGRTREWVEFLIQKTYDGEIKTLGHSDKFVQTESFKIYNLSHPGAGNFYMHGRLIEFLETNELPDYVYLQFSGLHRIDLHLSKSFNTKMFNPSYETVKETEWFKWLISGGSSGIWTEERSSQKILLPFYTDQNITNCKMLSLSYIQNCITILTNLKVKFNWTSWYNYFNPPGKFIKECEGKLLKWPFWFNTQGYIEDHPINYGENYKEFLDKNKNKFVL